MTGENVLENAQAEFAFAGLMGLRSQADYNRHFVMDEGGFAEELAKSDSLFQALEAFLAERGIRA